MGSREALEKALLAYRLLYPDGPEPRANYCIVSESMGFVQINRGLGDEITRITYQEIDMALGGKDFESLKSSQSMVEAREVALRDKMVADIMKKTRYKVACLKMREKVDQLMLEDCLNENARKGWALSSITRVSNFSLTSAAMSGIQKNFELVVVFERE